jgi:hypothetical protein
MPPRASIIRFIHHTEFPTEQKPTYARFVVGIKNHKAERESVRITVDGNLIDYPATKVLPPPNITQVLPPPNITQ